MSELLTIKTAAPHVGLHWKTVSRLVREGRIVASRVGFGLGTWRIAPEAIEAYLASTRNTTPPIVHRRPHVDAVRDNTFR